jgi:hypothetical protein
MPAPGTETTRLIGAVVEPGDHGGIAVVEEERGAGIETGDPGHLLVGELEVEESDRPRSVWANGHSSARAASSAGGGGTLARTAGVAGIRRLRGRRVGTVVRLELV